MSATPIPTPACADAAPRRVSVAMPAGADLALLCDSLPHIVWGASADGAIDYVNVRALEYTGVDPDTLPCEALAWLTLLHPDDAGGARQTWQDAARAGTEFELDFRIRGAGGAFRWFRAQGMPLRDEDGTLSRWFGTCMDVDEQKSAAPAGLGFGDREVKQVRENDQLASTDVTDNTAAEALRAAVMDHMAEGLYTTDPQGRVTSFNLAATRMLGWTEQELMGRSLHEVVHAVPDGKGHPVEDCPVSRAGSADQQVDNCEDLYLRNDGTTFEVAYSASTVHVGPTVAGVVVVFRDITELKQRQRQEVEGRHDQKLEALGRLSAGLAHEINTPIQFVGDNTRFLAEAYQTMLELLLVYRECLVPTSGQLPWEERKRRAEDAEAKADIDYLAEEVPGAVEQSLEGIDRVASLVRAMKAFSYKDTKEHSYADLNEGIRTTVIVARNEVKYVADVVLDLGELPDVLCNLGDLNQVFLNLLVNAADAMPEGGERGEIKITTRVEGSMVVIRFADNGSGIPEEIRKAIFDPFFTTKEVGKGTGQGLALAIAVCEKHGGTIEMNSEVGVGTEFVLTLPISGRRAGQGGTAPEAGQ